MIVRWAPVRDRAPRPRQIHLGLTPGNPHTGSHRDRDRNASRKRAAGLIEKVRERMGLGEQGE